MLKRKTCPTCKRPFETNYDGKIYCSKFCYPTYKRVLPTKRICPICQTEFIANTTQKICSQKCYAIHQTELNRIEKLKRRSLLPKAKCLWCGSEFLQRNGSYHVYCSLECGYAFRKMQKQIFRLFNAWQSELDKLKAQGKNYVLPEGS